MNDKEMVKYLNKKKINSHISPKKIKEIKYNEQELVSGFNAGGRPNGFWYSIGGAWLKFLIDNEGYLMDRYRPCCYIYSIKFKSKKNILSIKNPNKSKIFDYGYYWMSPNDLSRGANYIRRLSKIHLPLKRLFVRSSSKDGFINNLVKKNKIIIDEDKLIDTFDEHFNYSLTKKEIKYWKYPRWDLIENDYCGVEYPKHKHTDKYFWYDSVDVSSGCIWDTDCIQSIDLIATKKNGLWDLI